MFMVILKRDFELGRVKKAGPWIYICGRRKSGKTFFVKNFLQWDEYFFVRKDNNLIDKKANVIPYATFFELFKEIIERKTVVVDEFHRLPEEFFDYLHFLGIKGRLIVVSSTLWYSKKLLGTGSPLLGLFPTIIFGLVDEKDLLNSLGKKLRGEELIEASVYLREPLLARKYFKPTEEFLANFMNENKLSIREIIGEIFKEEERELSLVYEGIMRAIADGKNVSTEISSYLFSKNLISKDSPGFIQRYLDMLVKIGILEKIEVLNKNKFKYFHVSPVFDLHFYLDEKYSYSENEIPEKFVKKIVKEKIPLHAEQFFARFLSKRFGMKRVKIEEPELDIVLTEFKKIKVIAEVKWKKNIKRKEIEKIEEKFNKFKKIKKYLIVPNKKAIRKEIKNTKILDIRDILELAKKGRI